MLIAVCDDNQEILQEVRTVLAHFGFVSDCKMYSDINRLLYDMEHNILFDVVLMDIDWGEEFTGIDFASTVYQKSPLTKIIYITGHSDRYIQQVFLHPAHLSGYITKPISTEILRDNLQKILQDTEKQKTKLTVQYNGAIHSLWINEIMYLENTGHNTSIYTVAAHIISNERLRDIIPRLPNSFLQCHKSFCVNMDKIRRIDKMFILLKNHAEVPISKRNYARVRKKYFEYIGEMN